MEHRGHNEEEFRDVMRQFQNAEARLATKTEALLRVGHDLDEAQETCRQLRASAANYERNLERVEAEAARVKSQFEIEMKELITRLENCQESKKSLEAENKHLRTEMRELQKDCKTYRQKAARLELSHDGIELLGFDGNEVPAPIRAEQRSSSERMSGGTLDKYEKISHEHSQLVSDFQMLLTLKEESVSERDALQKKVDRLTAELSYMLNGDSRRVAEDLDSVLAENRFLKAQLSNAQEESEYMKATLAKYRAVAEEKTSKKPVTAPSPSPAATSTGETDGTLEEKSSVAVINMKQIREMLSSNAIDLSDGDYRALSTVLLDLCNDKQMALAHQRRANKILGSRLAEVESKLAKMEAKTGRSTSPFLLQPSAASRTRSSSPN